MPHRNKRLHAHQIAFFDMANAGADRSDGAGQFVAGRDAGARLELAAVEMQIGTADADAADGDLHFAGGRRRQRLLGNG